MPVRTSYLQGTPNWVDLQTTDQAGAKAFYEGLFGWTFNDLPMPDGAVYSMADLGDEQVAAIAPQSPELAAAGAPPMWNTYLAVDSVDDAAGQVEAAGGQVAMAPFDITDAGRMAFVLDPGGAAVALWQANKHIGATLVNEPGTVMWNELITSNSAAPKFYERVLGMTTAPMDDPTMGPYTLFMVNGEMVGGTFTSPSRTPTPLPRRSLNSAARSWPGRSTPRSAGWRSLLTRRTPRSASSSRRPASPAELHWRKSRATAARDGQE